MIHSSGVLGSPNLLFRPNLNNQLYHHARALPRACPRITKSMQSNSDQRTETAQKYNWSFDDKNTDPLKSAKSGRQIMELPVGQIRRPLGKTRSNDQEKVQALMDSIQEIGLKEPIDVLEVEGEYYGFSGCHRFEAHQRLGKSTILCRVRKANRQVLKMHMM